MSYDIYHDLVIHTNPEKVFNAISDPSHLINWWPKKCSGEPDEGCSYNFFFTSEYDWYGKVIQSDPSNAFYIQMTDADDDWNPTQFGFDLSPINDGTQVSFWHKGWPECNHHFKRSSYCWAILLLGLKNYVERGEIVPFELRE